ncbi:MAG TPA: hypothetical protein VNO30_20170 [Kofleriaceae bacterium]|nr:hypothetical protein [Kofleriaceae bacterium]
MRQWIVLVVVIGCTWTGAPAPRRPADATSEAVAQLIAVTSRGDVAATRALLHDAVELGGLWLEDTTCRKLLSSAGRVEGVGLDALARCLATLRLARSERTSPYHAIGVLTYEPGIEIEVLFEAAQGRPKIRWIGYVSRRSAKDALPTITQRALEAHRLTGSTAFDEPTRARLVSERAASRLPFSAAWLKVCIDASGAVTSVRRRETSSLAFQDALVAALERWTFRPVILGGQPTPVCALVWYGDPAGTAPPESGRALPFPVPPAYEATLVVASMTLKRIAGSGTVVPDDEAKSWLMANGISRAQGTFFFCITLQGTVDIVVTQDPTGVPRYDDQIRAVIRGMRYAPFLVDGRPAPVCAHLRFIYSQR